MVRGDLARVMADPFWGFLEMSVKVHIPTPMRQHTDGAATLQIAGASVQEVLDGLCGQFPGVAGRIFDAGKPRPFINFFLNDEDIRYLDGMKTAVKGGDELSIIPAVAGGQP